MSLVQRTWAVVLAAGDGTRLAQLTRDATGNPVPKQFCSLNGGASLLQDALQRARHLVPRERLCAIVAEQHRTHWLPTLWSLPGANRISQPVNRGTANGVLLSVLSILQRDPCAQIIFLPADHYVRDEPAMLGALRHAATLLTRNPASVFLVGIEPDEPDPELGYIVPGQRLPDETYTVQSFAEKPEPARARRLLSDGALWNSFIFAASGPTLLGILRVRLGDTVDRMARALAPDTRTQGSPALAEVYQQLPSVDFSRAVIEGSESWLRLVKAPPCGWSDLGTPARVAATLRRLSEDRAGGLIPPPSREGPFKSPATINLAARHIQLGPTG